jgi:hypothetical protein
MILLASVLGAAAIGALAVRYGVETRPGFDERPEQVPHRPNI